MISPTELAQRLHLAGKEAIRAAQVIEQTPAEAAKALSLPGSPYATAETIVQSLESNIGHIHELLGTGR